ncbi:putative secreted protein [Rhodopirellula sallentina SM41]|uniref:Putative secreted protein n=2 Tax=Rhodopirellula TaxID=265488 RepID=M5TX01_9BACT|nr:putative secreted protein [Rhodopirellula sallentina SM41]
MKQVGRVLIVLAGAITTSAPFAGPIAFVSLTVGPASRAEAADRTRCFLPIDADEDSATTPADADHLAAAENLPPADQLSPTANLSPTDRAIMASGVSPTEAFGIDQSSQGSDTDWLRYLAVWNAHCQTPQSQSIRRWLGLPQNGDVQITSRRGRVSPKFLPWRAGSFAVVQTPHFEILTRADRETSHHVARDLERFYWTWTQMFFPLWTGRDQVAIRLSDWNPQTESADDFLSRNASSRLSLRQRHRVVLLPDERSYQMTISHSQIAAGRPSTVAASAGFYSDSLETSFFFPQEDTSGMAHETCHQLFQEASDRKRSRRITLDTDEFWLVEGIAGHFESIQMGDRLACIGGWDSNRLQFARYQTLIARQPIASVTELRGNRLAIQRRSDLSRWYSYAILQTHCAIDAGQRPAMRAQVYRLLADIYNVDITDFPCLRDQGDDVSFDNSRVDRFLRVDDKHLIAHPIPGAATAICLSGCEVTQEGWKTLPTLPNVRWFDASRTPIDDEQVQRIIGDAASLDQLSLEATKITTGIGSTLAKANRLRELDLSWTAIDDTTIRSIVADSVIETLWLTGTGATDAAIGKLTQFKNLQTTDVQRTRISDSGLQRLRSAIPNLDLNPLQLAP